MRRLRREGTQIERALRESGYCVTRIGPREISLCNAVRIKWCLAGIMIKGDDGHHCRDFEQAFVHVLDKYPIAQQR